MSLKAELLTHAKALDAFAAEDYPLALSLFSTISDTSKIQWNIGIIHASTGQHEKAINHFGEAIGMDAYLAVGWFQRGVSHFMLQRYGRALADFDAAKFYMRGNDDINYTQLGLAYTLYMAEITFNIGLTKIYLGQGEGLQILRDASTLQRQAHHAVIDDAIRDQGRNYSVFSVPAGILFRPSETKLKNMEKRNYMGKAVLVAASDVNETFTTFTGITRLQRGQTPTGVPLDSSHPKALARSASVSAIPGPTDQTPIANRMLRSNALAVNPRLNPSSGVAGLDRPSRPTITIPGSPTAQLEDRHLYVTNVDGTTTVVTSPPPSAHRRSASDNSRITQSAYPGIGNQGLDLDLAQGLGLERNVSFEHRYPKSAMSSVGATFAHMTLDRKVSFSHPRRRKREQVQERQPTRLPQIQSQKPPAYDRRSPDEEMEVVRTPEAQPMRVANMSDIYDDYYGGDDDLAYLDSGDDNWREKILAANRQQKHQPARQFSVRSAGSRSLARSKSFGGNSLAITLDDDEGNQDMVKIRVKVHVGSLTRGMSIFPNETYDDLITALRSKFPELSLVVGVRFKDEDGDMLSMQDEGDFEAAIDVARVMSQGRAEGKLEIWVD